MNRYLPFLIVILFFSCSKENNGPLSRNQALSADCLIEAEPNDFFNECIFDTTFTCEVIELPDFFPISDDNKEWLKAFCLNNFDRIFFHNAEGEETFIEISNTIYNTNQLVAFDSCDNDVTRRTQYCATSEIASVEMRVPIASLTFDLTISNSLSLQSTGEFETLINIQANTFDFSDQNNPIFINHMRINPSLNFVSTQNFSSEIDILDRRFTDVYTSIGNFGSPDPDALQIFYNKEFGIVSFIDNNDTQWVLNE